MPEPQKAAWRVAISTDGHHVIEGCRSADTLRDQAVKRSRGVNQWNMGSFIGQIW